MAGKKDKDELLKLARKRMKLGMEALNDSRALELDDLKFFAGSPDNQWQWPNDVLNTRTSLIGQTIGARPCLTINKLPQHVRQITNEQRQNRPSGKVIPVSEDSDTQLAEVLTGMIRHIEYISDADVAYDTACDAQVTHGEGYLRLLTDYADDNSFEQEIRIGRVRNSFSVVLDPTMQDPCGSDAKWGFIFEDILKEDFEAKYPNATPISTLLTQMVGNEDISHWISEATVRIAEYFYIETEHITLYFHPAVGVYQKGDETDVALRERDIKPEKERLAERKTVCWVKTNGFEVLEENIWPGNWVPIVRVIGNEFDIEGKLHISGLVRNAKDPQRMYNYWASQEAEMLALAPKAPFIGYAGQFEGYEQQWKTANTVPWPYLEVNPEVEDGDGRPLPLPQRSQPPMPQAGLIQAKMAAAEDIKSTVGQYNAAIGMQGNERSGKAILERKRESDTGSYHYVDNLARAIRYLTRQIVDLIPKIYDTKRIARIVDVTGEVQEVEIDPEQPMAKREIKNPETGDVLKTIYNPGIGKYDVRIVTGPSYATKRQEASEAMEKVAQANPQLWATAGDLIVKHMDWPGAEELAERLKKTLPPELQDGAQSPELQQAKQQLQMLQEQNMQMQAMLQNVQRSFEQQELKIKEFDAETKRISILQNAVSPEQIQDIVLGTLHGMITAGDLVAGMPERDNSPELITNNPSEQGGNQ